MSCVSLLPLCSTPAIATREGQTGANAYLNIVGVGIWYASGQQFAFPNSLIAQDQSRTYVGTAKPNTFSKGFCGSSQAACPV